MIGYYDKCQRIIKADQLGEEVWISGRKFAQNEEAVTQKGFVMVCSCMETQFTYKGPSAPYHIRFPIKDQDNFDVKAYFQPIFQVMEKSRKSGKVLIHSDAGISRAGTLIIAYLIHRYKKTYKQALEEVREERPCVQPNLGFQKQLEWWQKFAPKLG